jgi:hypothetical protein
MAANVVAMASNSIAVRSPSRRSTARILPDIGDLYAIELTGFHRAKPFAEVGGVAETSPPGIGIRDIVRLRPRDRANAEHADSRFQRPSRLDRSACPAAELKRDLAGAYPSRMSRLMSMAPSSVESAFLRAQTGAAPELSGKQTWRQASLSTSRLKSWIQLISRPIQATESIRKKPVLADAMRGLGRPASATPASSTACDARLRMEWGTSMQCERLEELEERP